MKIPAPSRDLPGVQHFKPRKTLGLLGAEGVIDQSLTYEILQNHVLEEKKSRKTLASFHQAALIRAESAHSIGVVAMCLMESILLVGLEGASDI